MMNASTQKDSTNSRQQKKRGSYKIIASEKSKNESEFTETSLHKQQSSRATKPCFDFIKGNCARGSACKFEHALNDALEPQEVVQPPSKRTKTCFAFQKGNCTRGAECKFEHSIVSYTISSDVSGPNIMVGNGGATNAGESSIRPRNTEISNKKKRSMQASGADGTTSIAITALKSNSNGPSDMDCSPAPHTGQAVHMSSVEFRSLSISPLTKKALAETMKYELMTEVQALSLPVILSGHDCLAKAKTGTGTICLQCCLFVFCKYGDLIFLCCYVNDVCDRQNISFSYSCHRAIK